MCVVGTEARLLLLLGSLLPWSLALHAAGLLGRELRPLSGGEVSSARTKLTPQRRCRSAEKKKCSKKEREKRRLEV